ncbi:MAG TPA: LPS assembly lipoprotein LptE [Vicinamibacterales bacterium]|nr:LPS assembly lipoprotein LptE [Vicinamibacterales bacterium]
MGTGITRELPDSIAVLPFRTIGVAPAQERLGQGLCDALITRLANVPQLGVRPTSAVRQYVDPNQDPVEIGRMQGADAVLDGRIQGEGSRVRVTVQLIDTLSGATVWSSQIDTRDENALDIQDRISSQVFAEMMRDLPRKK